MTTENYYKDKAKRLADNGYLPLPVARGGKNPLPEKWPSYVFDPDDSNRYASSNVGVLSGRGKYPLLILDLDSKDPEIRRKIEKLIEPYYHLVREWDAPKAQFIFLAETEGLPRMVSKTYDDRRYESLPEAEQKTHHDQFHMLEIRGARNQSVFYGFNRNNGKTIRWIGAEPVDVPAWDLSVLPLEVAKKAAEILEKTCEERGWKLKSARLQEGPGKGQEMDTFAYAIAKNQRDDIPLQKAAEYLEQLPAECCDNRDEWIRIGMALHFQYDGSENAYRLFDRWSRKSDKYAGEKDTQRVWDSFGRNLARTPVTFGTIKNKVKIELARIHKEQRSATIELVLSRIRQCKDSFDVLNVLKDSHIYDAYDRDIVVRSAIARIKELDGEAPSAASIKAYLPTAPKATPYEYTQDGNRDRFVDKYKGDLIYVENLEKWYYWNGHIWEETSNACVIELASKAIRRMADEAGSVKDPEAAKALLKFCASSQNYDMYRKMVELAKGDEKIRVAHGEKLDSLERFIAVENGEFDLENFELVEPRREHFITRKFHVKYDPQADCPVWKKAILEILGTEEKVRYLQRAIGYAMSGAPSRDVFLVCVGSGRNGKTTVNNVIKDIFGDCAYHAQASSFVRSRHDLESGFAKPRPDVVNMLGMRYVCAQEPGKGLYLDEELIKPLTGRDGFPTRRLHSNSIINVSINGLFTMHANEVPKLRDTGMSMQSRMHILHFDQTFAGKEDVDLPSKLKEEYSGIFNWFLEGLKDYRDLGGLFPPEGDVERTKEYFDDLSADSDYTAMFLEECFDRVPDSYCPVRDINDAWNTFVTSHGLHPSYQGLTRGSRRIRALRDENGARRFIDVANPGKLKGKFIKGLALKSEAEMT